MPRPEGKALENIDRLLTLAGWAEDNQRFKGNNQIVDIVKIVREEVGMSNPRAFLSQAILSTRSRIDADSNRQKTSLLRLKPKLSIG
jgi:hypothetical protein